MVEEEVGQDVGRETVEAAVKAPGDRDLLVSDDEREHVVGVLQKAIGRGMLDLNEFTERTDIALAARTRGELNAVLTDLPGLQHADAVRQHAFAPPRAYVPAFTGKRLELLAKYSTLHRGGHWIVPPALLVRNKYGSTKLDFTDAYVEHPVVDIELDIRWGSCEIIIPQTATVDLNQIGQVKLGSLEDRTKSNGFHGAPRYVVSGRLLGGSLCVRNPRRGLFG